MSKARAESAASGYRIGAVARLTGIAADTLRIWERRCGVVEPSRTERGTRTYSAQDVTRLMMIKQLVDTGDAIGVVATLSSAELQARVVSASAVPSIPEVTGPCRVVVIGRPLATRLSDAMSELEDIEVVGTLDSPDQVTRRDDKPSPDVLIVELPALSSTGPQDVMSWLDRSGAYHAIVLYRFGHADALNGLRTYRITPLRAPIEFATLRRHCLGVLQQRATPTTRALQLVRLTEEPVQQRRYDDQTLAKIGSISTAVKCECPHHLAELIQALAAFETHSSQCEIRNTQDAALHAYLYTTRAQARASIEDALAHVIEAEDLNVCSPLTKVSCTLFPVALTAVAIAPGGLCLTITKAGLPAWR